MSPPESRGPWQVMPRKPYKSQKEFREIMSENGFLLVPEEGLEPSQGYPYRILSPNATQSTTGKNLETQSFHSPNCFAGWQLPGLVGCSTRTKGGRKSALYRCVHLTTCPINPIRIAPVSCPSLQKGDGNGKTSKVPVVRSCKMPGVSDGCVARITGWLLPM